MDFWGKWKDKDAWLPLSAHCLDVATVFIRLARLHADRGAIALAPSQIERLAVLAFLHDLGKCNWGFQAKVNPQARENAGHVLEAMALLAALGDLWPLTWRQLLEEIVGWFNGDDEAAMQMLIAAISHHGRPVSWDDYEQSAIERKAHHLWQKHDGIDPLQGLEELANTARATFPNAFATDAPAIAASPALQQRFAGLVMLADWIGSDTRFFPFNTPPDRDRATFAREAAGRALRVIGLEPPGRRACHDFVATFGFSPSALQSALLQDLDPTDTHRLLLVESDTGSGKTEAALAWFFRLYTENKVDGLYFGLPTRVAARELYERVRKAVDAAFEPETRPGPVLLAAPGYVKVDGEPVLPDPMGTLWDDNRCDLQREHLWAAERPKRFLAAPVGVGTIDQALLSVLQVKHSLLRSVCLDRHLLVVDEVHASDPYMREVLRALLNGHVRRGGWALLLSATLGEVAAASYFQRPPQPLDQALARPYPALSGYGFEQPIPASRRGRAVRVAPASTLTDDEALAPLLIEALRRGARVLVVCNTVGRANGLFRRMEAMLEVEAPDLLPSLFTLNGVRCPHHGRFARSDREQLDARVTALLGKESPSGARLVIGTQTLEQSLDIDADWLVTDLAPMDVLLQRVGRLHRHTRVGRPVGYETPAVLVRVPDRPLNEFLHNDGTLHAPAGLGSVYADGRILARTWLELAERGELHLPEDARALIEYTTHPEAIAALPDEWRAHGQHIEGKELAEIRAALHSVLDNIPFGELHYPDKSERVVTRLGLSTLDLPLEEPCGSPFGTLVERILIPAHWLPEGGLPDTVAAQPNDDGFNFRIGDRAFRYTRFGLEKDDE